MVGAQDQATSRRALCWFSLRDSCRDQPAQVHTVHTVDAAHTVHAVHTVHATVVQGICSSIELIGIFGAWLSAGSRFCTKVLYSPTVQRHTSLEASLEPTLVIDGSSMRAGGHRWVLENRIWSSMTAVGHRWVIDDRCRSLNQSARFTGIENHWRSSMTSRGRR